VENFEFFKHPGDHLYVKQLNFTPPSWDTLLKSLDAAMSDDTRLVRFKDRFGFISWNTSDIPETRPILTSIEQQNPGAVSYSAHLYLSMSVHSEVYGRHNDNADVWYWQCQGITRWKVWENDQEYYYILKPGDWIFVPQHIDHDAKPLTPRAGISFAAEHLPLPPLVSDSIFNIRYAWGSVIRDTL
jgi:hypothetical protein